MTQRKFAVGEKVKIKEGGWGFHPNHVGEIVTIHSITPAGRYTTEETLSNGSTHFPHRARESSVDGRSFEAVAQNTSDQIRALNVLIKTENARIAEAEATIEAAEGVKGKLVRQRQVLVATLLRELDA